MGLPRLLFENRLWDAETVLSASSEVPTLPATFLQDQLRQKPWRTRTGWTIVAGFNDKLDFNRSGDHTATIPPGTYVSGDAMALAIQTAMRAADAGPPIYEVTYTAANKFRIRDPGGAPINFNLEWSTGANAATSIGKDIGFNTAADDTGTTDYTSDEDAYQSRHFLKIHRSDGGTLVINAVILLEHNLNGHGLVDVRIQGNTTDSWGSPTFDTAITFAANYDPAVQFLGGNDCAWHRLYIDDVQNPMGYSEIGIFYFGGYRSLSYHPSSNDLANEPQDFSAVETGVAGTHFVDTQRRRDCWALAWNDLPTTESAIFDELVAGRRLGQNFFLVWNTDAPNSRGDGIDGTTYGFYPATPRKQYVPADYWTWSFALYEAL